MKKIALLIPLGVILLFVVKHIFTYRAYKDHSFEQREGKIYTLEQLESHHRDVKAPYTLLFDKVAKQSTFQQKVLQLKNITPHHLQLIFVRGESEHWRVKLREHYQSRIFCEFELDSAGNTLIQSSCVN